MRWSEAEFYALADEEQNRWLAWEYRRGQEIRETVRGIMENKNDRGKLTAETVSAQTLLALLELS